MTWTQGDIPDLKGEVILITGANSGIGYEAARMLAASGAHVALACRNPDKASEARDRLANAVAGASLEILPLDLSDLGSVKAAAEAFVDRHDRLDALINNAGILGPSPRPDLEAFDIDDLAELFRANTLGPVCLTQAALPSLKSSRGVVINVTSDAGATGYPGWGGYGASKAALELISQSWAAELKGEGVRVHAVNPGDLKTEMHQRAFPGEDISDRLDPASVTAIFVWLASEHAAPMSGQRFDAPGFEQPDAAQ